MADKKKDSTSFTTLAEDLRKLRKRKLTPEQIKELNELLEGPTDEPPKEKDKKSARHPEPEA